MGVFNVRNLKFDVTRSKADSIEVNGEPTLLPTQVTYFLGKDAAGNATSAAEAAAAGFFSPAMKANMRLLTAGDIVFLVDATSRTQKVLQSNGGLA